MKLLWTALALLFAAAGPAFSADTRSAPVAPATQTATPRPTDAPPSTEGTPYIRWLEEHSMLHQARQLALRYSGNSAQ